MLVWRNENERMKTHLIWNVELELRDSGRHFGRLPSARGCFLVLVEIGFASHLRRVIPLRGSANAVVVSFSVTSLLLHDVLRRISHLLFLVRGC